MLKKLRNRKTQKRIFIFLALIIVPAFAFWGLSGALHGPKEPMYAGSIFGRKITLSEYKDSLGAVRNTALIMYGENLSQMQQYLNLEAQAWERLILLEEAKKNKITANDEEVVKLIQNYPFFQRKGAFDEKLYSQYLQYVFGTQKRPYEEQVRQNIILSKLYKQVTDGIEPDKEETIRDEYRKANEEISVEYLASIPSDLSKDIAVSEEDLKDFFNKNSLDFKLPITFNIEYVSTDSADKIKKLALSLDKPSFLGLFKRFSKNKTGKNDFESAAKDAGLEIKETGFFNQSESVPGIGWAPEILNLITQLKNDEYSNVIQMDKRFIILKLKEKKESYIPDFESVKEKVRDSLIKKKARDLAYSKIEECSREPAPPQKNKPKIKDLAKKSKECGLKYGVSQPFKYGSYIEGIGQSDNLWLKARDLKTGELSGIIDIGPGGFYIIKVKTRTPIDEKKFAAEKNEFTQNLLQRKKDARFLEYTQELQKKAQLF